MNYLYGWNSVAEFIWDELVELGVPVDGVVIDDAFVNKVTIPKNIQLYAASEVEFQKNDEVINCLGYKDLFQRIKVGERLLNMQVLRSYISPNARVHYTTKIGVGTVLVGDVVIERGCAVGKHCLLWGGARICHDSTIQQGVFMASGSIIGGACAVGSACSLGFNSSMKEKTTMPEGTKVGANRFWCPAR